MIKNYFEEGKKVLIGMVHALPLPGSLGFRNNMEEIIAQAVEDAKTLERAGFTAVMVENMGDSPFSEKLNKAQVAALAVVAAHVKANVNIPVGIDAAFNDYEAALGIAKSVGAEFIRVPVFVDTVVFDGGILYPQARACLIYRKEIQADDVLIFADIQVKHTHPLIPTITMEESARNAQAAGADAVIVTGSAIGKEAPIDIIKRVKGVVRIPILAGSGVKPENIKSQMEIADGAIIGSSLKKSGVISNPIDYELAKELLDTYKGR